MKWEAINNIITDFIGKRVIDGDVTAVIFKEKYDDDGNSVLELAVTFDEIAQDEAESDGPVLSTESDDEETYGKRDDYHGIPMPQVVTRVPSEGYSEGNM